MADIGLNFRNTAGFVTDGGNETYCLHTDSYPTTRDGVTFGWVSGSIDSVDRESGNDRRLAGINFTGVNTAVFRLDLPATGTYDVHLAVGDAGGGHPDTVVVIKDDTTTKFTVGPDIALTQEFFDATGVLLTDTTWPTSETPQTVAFATTTLRLELSSATQNGVLAHLRVVSAGGSAVLSGTAIGGITEADVVSGGRTVIITLTGDTWIS